MKIDKTEMVPVPLPTEIPTPPNLDHIPLDILHSATVEMLIQQNEDLSSRLKVNLRRNSQIEQKNLEYEKTIADLLRQKENVLAQIEIVKEKEKIWSSKKEEQSRQNESLNNEMQLLELRYNELYTTSQQRSKEQRTELVTKAREVSALNQKNEIQQKVRHRAKEKLRALLLRMAQGYNRDQQNIRKHESSNRMLKKRFEDLQTEFLEKETFFKEQLDSLKNISKKSLMDIDLQLAEAKEKVITFNSQKELLEQQVEDLNLQLHKEKKNRIKISQLSDDLNQIKNENIKVKRDLQLKFENAEKAWSSEKVKHSKTEQDREDLKIQLNEQKEVLSTCETKLLSLAKDNKEISSQLTSTQQLWMDSQTKLEKLELRCQALEKINRQLSKQSQEEKMVRATTRAHETPEQPKTVVTEKHKEFQNKVQNVFATQYRTMAKEPDLDV